MVAQKRRFFPRKKHAQVPTVETLPTEGTELDFGYDEAPPRTFGTAVTMDVDGYRKEMLRQAR